MATIRKNAFFGALLMCGIIVIGALAPFAAGERFTNAQLYSPIIADDNNFNYANPYNGYCQILSSERIVRRFFPLCINLLPAGANCRLGLVCQSGVCENGTCLPLEICASAHEACESEACCPSNTCVANGIDMWRICWPDSQCRGTNIQCASSSECCPGSSCIPSDGETSFCWPDSQCREFGPCASYSDCCPNFQCLLPYPNDGSGGMCGRY